MSGRLQLISTKIPNSRTADVIGNGSGNCSKWQERRWRCFAWQRISTKVDAAEHVHVQRGSMAGKTPVRLMSGDGGEVAKWRGTLFVS